MVDRGDKLTDAESWEFLATAATAKHAPDGGRSVHVYRFERLVPRPLLARLPASLFSGAQSELLSALVDVSGCALMKLTRPLSVEDKMALWYAVRASCDRASVPASQVSERRFRAELLRLLLEHRTIDRVAKLERRSRA